MSCHRWRREISAWIDGNLPENGVERLRRHLDECGLCSRFYAEQREVTDVFHSAAQFQSSPPPFLWQRIESRIQAEKKEVPSTSVWDELLSWFRPAQLRYAVCAALLMVATGLVAVRTRGPVPMDSESLARLDAYSLEVSGNPFLANVEARNPFFGLDQVEPGNPFDLGGADK